MSTNTSNENEASNEDIPQTVQERLSTLSSDKWAGELAAVECTHCGHNSWAETDDDLGYERHWAHHVEAYECLYCGATGGRVVDGRNDTPVTARYVGCMESMETIDWGIDSDNPPWADDGDSA
jgi:Zn ribbon nucleic-acid-binding protein